MRSVHLDFSIIGITFLLYRLLIFPDTQLFFTSHTAFERDNGADLQV
jgi:hypothetical protein